MHGLPSPGQLPRHSHLEEVIRCFHAVLVEFKLRAKMINSLFAVCECDKARLLPHAMMEARAQVQTLTTWTN